MRRSSLRCGLWLTTGFLVVAAGTLDLAASDESLPGAETPDAPIDAQSPVLRSAAETDWIYAAESVQINATLVTTRTSEQISKNKATYVAEHPGFSSGQLQAVASLQPTSNSSFIWAWDRQRAVSRGMHPGWLEEVAIWDGKQFLARNHWMVYRSDQFAIRSEPQPELTANFFVWLPWQWMRNAVPLQTARVADSGGLKNHLSYREELNQFEFHSEVDFDGVPCRMFRRPGRGYWTRIYLECETGRFRGVRDGTWGIKWRQVVAEVLLPDLLSRSPLVTLENVDDVLEALPPGDRKAILQSAEKRLDDAYEKHLEELESITTITFADWREVVPGRVFPYRQIHEQSHVVKPGVVETGERRVFTIGSLAINQPLPGEVFQLPISEGARVYEDVDGYPFFYTLDRNRTPQEWTALREKARAAHQEDIDEKRRLDDLIGEPALELPTDGWMNTEAMKWEQFKGRYVILDFWHIGCGPCADSVAWMQALHANSEEGIAVIGVHGEGVDAAELKAAIVKRFKRDMTFPICVDKRIAKDLADEASFESTLFQAFRVRRMPYCWLVGPDRRLVLHGGMEECVSEARRRIRAK